MFSFHTLIGNFASEDFVFLRLCDYLLTKKALAIKTLNKLCATGIVTTARLTHATPAATYAHSYNRDWECDSAFATKNRTVSQPDDLHDIAHQLVHGEVGRRFKVAMGGGYPAFFPKSMKDELFKKVKNWTKAN